VSELFGHILLQSRHEHSQSPYRNKLSIQGHKKILAAIKAEDSKAANELMAGHLDAIRELILSSNVHKKE
jgi:DNA-binding FadR family transcriptional regulator